MRTLGWPSTDRLSAPWRIFPALLHVRPAPPSRQERSWVPPSGGSRLSSPSIRRGAIFEFRGAGATGVVRFPRPDSSRWPWSAPAAASCT